FSSREVRTEVDEEQIRQVHSKESQKYEDEREQIRQTYDVDAIGLGYTLGYNTSSLDDESLESKVMRNCCFVVVGRDAWLGGVSGFGFGVGELTLSSLDVLQGLSFFLQMGFTLILATLDGLDVGLLGDVIGEDDCDDDG
ncbi:hypothetical protein Tco_1237603, partial [Tanacetum coccineum]